MNSASAAIAPPPASSSRCGAAPGQQQAGLRAGQPVLGAGQLPPVQPGNHERRQPAVRPVHAAQARQRFQSGDICGHEHRRGTGV
jgi:hypothetical protein